jgi:multiple sugar transport system substrate-binding protein
MMGFRQGRIAMVFEGIYMLNDLKKQTDLDFGAAETPVLGEQPATWADSHVMCFKPGMDDRKVRAAWTLVKYLSDNSLTWAGSGQVPVRKSILSSPEFAEFKEQSIFARQIPYVVYFPRIPFTAEFVSNFDAALERSLRGAQSPKEALTWANGEINKAIARYQAAEAARDKAERE